MCVRGARASALSPRAPRPVPGLPHSRHRSCSLPPPPSHRPRPPQLLLCAPVHRGAAGPHVVEAAGQHHHARHFLLVLDSGTAYPTPAPLVRTAACTHRCCCRHTATSRAEGGLPPSCGAVHSAVRCSADLLPITVPSCVRRYLRHRDAALVYILVAMACYMWSVSNHQVRRRAFPCLASVLGCSRTLQSLSASLLAGRPPAALAAGCRPAGQRGGRRAAGRGAAGSAALTEPHGLPPHSTHPMPAALGGPSLRHTFHVPGALAELCFVGWAGLGGSSALLAASRRRPTVRARPLPAPAPTPSPCSQGLGAVRQV